MEGGKSRAHASADAGGVTDANVEAVLTAYASWQGGFRDFCDHVRDQLGIRWGRDTIARVLEQFPLIVEGSLEKAMNVLHQRPKVDDAPPP